MPQFALQPHVGVGPVHFGMTREAVRAVMRTPPTPFARGPSDGAAIEAYHGHAFQVHYDPEGRVEFVELARDPALHIIYQGRDLLTLPAQEAVELLARETPFDPEDAELGYSYVFPSLDLSLWRETIPDDADDREGHRFSAIGLGAPGYFSSSAR